ncbi:sensor domain-containing diguanylate cyclase [Paenibacillus macquariensis]|uniref:Diguanylate cyclase (GGDEF) domain-containing protein n=1 Tax=Paenibacillus macquariensis TaxID=948756 RepID=A0ABY1JWR4_9BACL|nr:sensor domain-containing diguanylate cyclase [Paenibacillus macquariensis]MEC0089433.1 sensor domain-containing diguanylate cyclase [Paenibacillus macquariensis]SIQ91436.1 diguanylate cyclase (GGDEF) domain-containing protein [Paenibacillus macquariensis]
MRKHKGFKLRTILGMLVIGSVLITAVLGGYMAYISNISSLSSSYLENNHNYAQKLSSNTSDLLNVMQNNISYIAEIAGQESFSQKDLDIVYRGNDQYFNSIVISNSNREVRFVNPGDTGVNVGTRLTSDASLQASLLRKPMISEPYVAVSGRLILMVSAPIYNDRGTYIGFAGGTLYLQEDNALSKLLMEHFYGNGSYVYVSDQQGRLIYHPVIGRVNEIVKNNKAIERGLSGQSGSQRVVNSKGKSFFAGFAYEPISEWVIVSQTPTAIMDKPLREMLISFLMKDIPLFLIILLIAMRVSYYISTPLYRLAQFSEEAFDSKKANPPSLPKISSIIYEVNQLHKSMGKYLNLLNEEIQIDGLTGLSNRKTFDLNIQEWYEEKIPFALILVDMDHFKQINDTYGHARGDEVLKFVASQLKLVATPGDVCFRYGGEEFGILVKYAERQSVMDMAELLRKKIAESECPNGGKGITISIGVALSDTLSGGPEKVIEFADQALYQSKKEGRNRTNIYED